MNAFGAQSMTGALKRVLVRPPLPDDAAAWRDYGWRAEPDPVAAAREHESLCLLLEEAGAEVVVSLHDAGNPDSIYVYDPVLGRRTRASSVCGRARRGGGASRTAVATALRDAGVPVAHEVAEPAIAEGGDTVWLDERTLLVGHGYRTNAAGIAALEAAFPGVEVIRFDLPHWNGAGEVMHLMSLVSLLAADLALVYPRLAPVRLPGAARRAWDPDGRGSRRGVRIAGLERARARPASRAGARGERRDAAATGEAPASTSSPTAATRSRARATAARPA